MPTPPAKTPIELVGRGTWPEVRRIGAILRTDTVGGALLLVAAILAIIWATTPWHDTYHQLREFQVGPASLHLDLTLGQWAAEGLLAIFFFVASLKLKRESIAGDHARCPAGGAADRRRARRDVAPRADLPGDQRQVR
ncbi:MULTISPECIES: Na+/H+ antiporter NhaA [unclassified Micromonospora]|uniref:Na+/H+ antiporter NhaA n=1 Tax=unclassified Micromonospora TaxID=2617518 RepID=UPI002FF356D3